MLHPGSEILNLEGTKWDVCLGVPKHIDTCVLPGKVKTAST